MDPPHTPTASSHNEVCLTHTRERQERITSNKGREVHLLMSVQDLQQFLRELTAEEECTGSSIWINLLKNCTSRQPDCAAHPPPARWLSEVTMAASITEPQADQGTTLGGTYCSIGGTHANTGCGRQMTRVAVRAGDFGQSAARVSNFLRLSSLNQLLLLWCSPSLVQSTVERDPDITYCGHAVQARHDV